MHDPRITSDEFSHSSTKVLVAGWHHTIGYYNWLPDTWKGLERQSAYSTSFMTTDIEALSVTAVTDPHSVMRSTFLNSNRAPPVEPSVIVTSHPWASAI